MNRVSRIVPVVAATTLLLSACGSSDSADPAPAESSSPPSSSSTTSATSTSSSDAIVYNLPGSGVFPEGITASGDSFFVTSTSDGAVFRGTVGSPDVSVFLPGGADGRTAAAGIDVTDDDDLDDRATFLVIAGGATGRVWVYDPNSGNLVAMFTNGLGQDATFLNDVAIADNGDVYVTDSRSPALYRIPLGQITDGVQDGPLETFVNFDGTPFVYGEGFNANGIVENDDESALIVVQSSTGNLYRIDKATKEVVQVDLGGATLVNGDGLETDDDTLYVVRNRDGLIAEVDLNDDGRSGSVTGEITDASFAYPTTVAALDDRLYVVNSQFDKRGGEPVEPFTVSSIPE